VSSSKGLLHESTMFIILIGKRNNSERASAVVPSTFYNKQLHFM
jgi:hypothetical protein